MKREVYFRGKMVASGEWVIGNYIAGSFKLKDIGRNNPFISNQYGLHVEVHGDTVGQYVGLRDSFGVPIMEGDVLKYDGNKHTVEWGTQGWLPDEFPLCDAKVIGTIHD